MQCKGRFGPRACLHLVWGIFSRRESGLRGLMCEYCFEARVGDCRVTWNFRQVWLFEAKVDVLAAWIRTVHPNPSNLASGKICWFLIYSPPPSQCEHMPCPSIVWFFIEISIKLSICAKRPSDKSQSPVPRSQRPSFQDAEVYPRVCGDLDVSPGALPEAALAGRVLVRRLHEPLRGSDPLRVQEGSDGFVAKEVAGSIPGAGASR